MDHFCYLCFVFVMVSSLFVVALWSPADKELTSWLSCVYYFIAFLLLFHVVSRVNLKNSVYLIAHFDFV